MAMDRSSFKSRHIFVSLIVILSFQRGDFGLGAGQSHANPAAFKTTTCADLDGNHSEMMNRMRKTNSFDVKASVLCCKASSER